jgi:hypothetical protein
MMASTDENTKAGCLDWSNGKSEVRNVVQVAILTRILLSFHSEMQRAFS